MKDEVQSRHAIPPVVLIFMKMILIDRLNITKETHRSYTFAFSLICSYSAIKKKGVFRYLDIPGMPGQWEKNIKIGKVLCKKD